MSTSAEKKYLKQKKPGGPVNGTESRGVINSGRRRDSGTTTVVTSIGDHGSYEVVCVDHREKIEFHLRNDAMQAARHPTTWCQECRKKVSGKHKAPLPPLEPEANRGYCHGCRQVRGGLVIYTHLDSEEVYAACPVCHKDERVRNQVRKMFDDLIQHRRKEWRGFSREERKKMVARTMSPNLGQGKGEGDDPIT